ncbi:hypothetical protein AD997_10355 [Erwinia amylovora]|nr:hypothetical protein AD997_10355 [Erwinia amylovora]RUT16977.1 hypothetical protein BEI72_01100 [Erwinia amylovora]
MAKYLVAGAKDELKLAYFLVRETKPEIIIDSFCQRLFLSLFFPDFFLYDFLLHSTRTIPKARQLYPL